MKNKGYAKFWVANKVYYGTCASSIFTTVFWQMELICANSKRDFGTKFTRHVQNFAYHVPLNHKPTGFAQVNGKNQRLVL